MVDLEAYAGDSILGYINTYGSYKKIYAYQVLENGDEEIEIVSLDDDIKKSVMVIKMDIECAEKEVVPGARGHLVNEKPKLLISAYHNPEDLFEFSAIIHGICEEYKFFVKRCTVRKL